MKNCGDKPRIEPLETNHCVVLVGFNDTTPTPYWIVKNVWGIGGYMYLEKGATCATWPRCPTPAFPRS